MTAPGHRAVLDRLPPARMAALTRLSDRPGLVRLASHLALVGLGILAVLASEGWLRLAAQFGLGVVLSFLFSLCHEAVHRTAFRTGWLNDRAAAAAGFAILLPARAFRCFHFAHHRFTQDPVRDPELARPKPRTLAGYLWRLSGRHYWTGQAHAILGAAFGRGLPAWVPPRGAAKVRREARLHLAGYAALAGLSVALGSTLLWQVWVLPLLMGQPVLRAFLMAEHTGCATVADMLVNSRTTFASRAVRWLSWEMPFHTAHHAAPTVPFHRLGALTDDLDGVLGVTAAGYPDAHRQILAGLVRQGGSDAPA